MPLKPQPPFFKQVPVSRTRVLRASDAYLAVREAILEMFNALQDMVSWVVHHLPEVAQLPMVFTQLRKAKEPPKYMFETSIGAADPDRGKERKPVEYHWADKMAFAILRNLLPQTKRRRRSKASRRIRIPHRGLN